MRCGSPPGYEMYQICKMGDVSSEAVKSSPLPSGNHATALMFPHLEEVIGLSVRVSRSTSITRGEPSDPYWPTQAIFLPSGDQAGVTELKKLFGLWRVAMVCWFVPSAFATIRLVVP